MALRALDTIYVRTHPHAHTHVELCRYVKALERIYAYDLILYDIKAYYDDYTLLPRSPFNVPCFFFFKGS